MHRNGNQKRQQTRQQIHSALGGEIGMGGGKE